MQHAGGLGQRTRAPSSAPQAGGGDLMLLRRRMAAPASTTLHQRSVSQQTALHPWPADGDYAGMNQSESAACSVCSSRS